MTRGMSEAAENILGRRRRIKQPWVSEDTLKLCDRRREKKANRLNGEIQAKKYRSANIMVRRELNKSKEAWIMKQCETIEACVKRNNTKKAYQILKRLTNTRQTTASIINERNGSLIWEINAVAERWQEYCQELYNVVPTVDKDIIVRLHNSQIQEEKKR